MDMQRLCFLSLLAIWLRQLFHCLEAYSCTIQRSGLVEHTYEKLVD